MNDKETRNRSVAGLFCGEWECSPVTLTSDWQPEGKSTSAGCQASSDDWPTTYLLSERGGKVAIGLWAQVVPVQLFRRLSPLPPQPATGSWIGATTVRPIRMCQRGYS